MSEDNGQILLDEVKHLGACQKGVVEKCGALLQANHPLITRQVQLLMNNLDTAFVFLGSLENALHMAESEIDGKLKEQGLTVVDE